MNWCPTRILARYSDALNELRKSRGVGGKFEHNLIAIDIKGQKATFKTPDGKVVSIPNRYLFRSKVNII